MGLSFEPVSLPQKSTLGLEFELIFPHKKKKDLHHNSTTPHVPGVVRSVRDTLSSQFVENCKGVVQRLTLQEHKMVWNRTTHLWYVPIEL